MATGRAKRFLFWQVVLLPTYTLACVLAGLGYSWSGWWPYVRAVAADTAEYQDALRVGPATVAFNTKMYERAEKAGLVGSPEQRVVAVLGPPDNVRQFWEVLGPDLSPAPGAKFVTTYEYYPFPNVPFSKVQVHCTDGIVRTVERYDD